LHAFGAGPEEATETIQGLERLSCEERLRELGPFYMWYVSRQQLYINRVTAKHPG